MRETFSCPIRSWLSRALRTSTVTAGLVPAISACRLLAHLVEDAVLHPAGLGAGDAPLRHERRERRDVALSGAAPRGGVHPAGGEVEQHRLPAPAVALRARPVALDRHVVRATAAGDLDGVPAGLLGDVGDGGVAAADERRGGRVEGGGVGADAAHPLLTGRGPHLEARRGALRSRADHVARAQAHRVEVGVERPARDRDAVGAGVGTAGTAAGVERVGRQRVEGVAADHHVVGAGRLGL